MKIGIIGTGSIGTTLAQRWSEKGHQIMLGSRDPQRAQTITNEKKTNVSGGLQKDAAAFGDVIVFAFPWYALVDVAREIGKCKGKIIIDCINPITSSGSLAIGHKWSAGEEIAQTFPAAHVVKAFNHIYVGHLRQPLFNEQPANAFYCSNYDDAKEVAAQLAVDLGLEPIDIGPLKHARYLEPLALLWIQLAFHVGLGPDFTFKLLMRELKK